MVPGMQGQKLCTCQCKEGRYWGRLWSFIRIILTHCEQKLSLMMGHHFSHHITSLLDDNQNLDKCGDGTWPLGNRFLTCQHAQLSVGAFSGKQLPWLSLPASRANRLDRHLSKNLPRLEIPRQEMEVCWKCVPILFSSVIFWSFLWILRELDAWNLVPAEDCWYEPLFRDLSFVLLILLCGSYANFGPCHFPGFSEPRTATAAIEATKEIVMEKNLVKLLVNLAGQDAIAHHQGLNEESC